MTNSIIDNTVLMQLRRLMGSYKLAIKSNMKRYGKWTTGRTWSSIIPYADLDASGKLSVGLEAPNNSMLVKLQETGRKPGKVPSNFEDIIYQWSIDKGIQFSSDKERKQFAKAVKWKTINEGSVQFRNGTNYDIYTKLEPMYETKTQQLVNSAITNKVNNILDIFK